jgi:hypothetical protein
MVKENQLQRWGSDGREKMNFMPIANALEKSAESMISEIKLNNTTPNYGLFLAITTINGAMEAVDARGLALTFSITGIDGDNKLIYSEVDSQDTLAAFASQYK